MKTERYTINGVTYIEYSPNKRVIARDRYFRSTDEKPIEGVPNSEFGVEIDTGKVFVFDEEVKAWNEM